MKKLFLLILVLSMVLSITNMALAASDERIANKTLTTVLVDGVPVQFETYQIDNLKYYRLRDVAKAVSGSENQFDIIWNQKRNAVEIITGKAYTEVGGELQLTDSPKTVKVDYTNEHTLYVDGLKREGSILYINGNGYMRLTSLGTLVGFGTTWDYVNGNKITIDTRPFARNEYKLSTNPPYTFSKTKLDYPYNIYIEGKGYMNFGKDKPFLDKDGALYLPIKHLAHFGGWEYVFEPVPGSITLGRYYTEETAYKILDASDYHVFYYKESGEPVYFAYDQYGNPIVNDTSYDASHETILKVNSSDIESKKISKPTKWAIDFVANGGIYLDGGYRFDISIDRISNTTYSSDPEYIVLLKDGEPYWERTSVTSIVGTSMLIAEHEKTLYYGSDEYLQKIMEEVVNPNLKMDDSFNDGKTYMETMDDLFKDIPVYIPPKN